MCNAHTVYLSSLLRTFPPLILPVLLAAIRPIFLPALAPLQTVEALPICWWLPPPWGCSTGFMHTPRTLGQQFLFTLYLWYARPAFNNGLSIRPPPATIPTLARLNEGMTFLIPEGNFTRVTFVSLLCVTTVAYPPDARASFPRSPDFSSTLDMIVPSGMTPTGRMFPI